MARRGEPEAITEHCTAHGCDRPVRATSTLCDSHYRQERRHGRTFRLARYQRSILPKKQEAA